MFAFGKNIGLHVFVHNKTHRPSYFEGFDVSVDTQTDLTIERTFIERQPAPYSNCVEDPASYGSIFTNMFSRNNLTYKQTQCYEYCYQRKLVDTCGCKHILSNEK
jgi:hypothetical protein